MCWLIRMSFGTCGTPKTIQQVFPIPRPRLLGTVTAFMGRNGYGTGQAR